MVRDLARWLVAVALGACIATACSLDDRHLVATAAGTGGSRSEEAGPSSTGGRSGSGGDAGSKDGGSTNLDGGFIDGGTCPDCEPPNIVYNPDFDIDTDGWNAEPDGDVAWAAMDAADLDWSGSISVENDHVEDIEGMTAVGARQCALAIPGKTYELSAKVTIEVTEGSGSGHLNVKFFEGDNCEGEPLPGGFTTSSSARIGGWENDHGETEAPSKAGSIAVRLVATKPLKDPALKVVFDEIRVIEK